MRRVPKRVRSLYVLYQRLFGYTSSATPNQKANYARAIAEAGGVIQKVWETRSLEPLVEHRMRTRTHPLAVQFLEHFERLVTAHGDALSRWQWVTGEIRLPASLFPEAPYDGLSIPFHYIYSVGLHEVVLLTYGPPRDMWAEVGALKTLVSLGTVQPPLPAGLKAVRYWELLHGDEHSVSHEDVPEVDRRRVLDACASLFEG